METVINILKILGYGVAGSFSIVAIGSAIIFMIYLIKKFIKEF